MLTFLMAEVCFTLRFTGEAAEEMKGRSSCSLPVTWSMVKGLPRSQKGWATAQLRSETITRQSLQHTKITFLMAVTENSNTQAGFIISILQWPKFV